MVPAIRASPFDTEEKGDVSMCELKGVSASCMALVVFVAVGVRAQAPSTSTTRLKTLVADQRVLAVVPWSAGQDKLVCIVSERQITVGEESGPARFMSVYQIQGDALAAVFEFQTLDGFIKAAPVFENVGRLFTAWSGGSAYHFRAYSWKAGRVSKVLEASSRGMPEFGVDGNEREWILVTEKTLVGNQWKRTPDSPTRTYRWDGVTYVLVNTVPWRKRFAAMSESVR